MALAIMILTTSPTLGQRPFLVHSAVAGLLSFAFAVLFLNVASILIESMGRDPTITGRTALWQELIGMNPNLLFGAGFESFWLGPRIERLWQIFAWEPNESHNGYLEIFLNLGLVGVTLLVIIIAAGYRNAIGLLRRDSHEGSLRLAYFVVGLTYSFTEAGFRIMNPVWIMFVLGATAVPASAAAVSAAKDAAAQVAASAGKRPGNVRRVPLRPLGRTTQGNTA
jgi:exopolysaccharide production protein ExoQ